MNLEKVPKKRFVAIAAFAAVLTVTAAAASSSRTAAHTGTAAASPVTLTVWDQEVRGGQNAAMTTLNANFQKKYPNIKINRVAKSFTDLQATLKLAASGPNPPDVIEANNGYSAMGPLVKAGLLLSMNKYASKYGWLSRYSTGILKMNKFTSDASQFGTGNLYGLPMTGEVVGVYYNKAKLKKLGLAVPTTFQAFQDATSKAQAAGETPIQFGNLDKWPGIHEFEEIMLQSVPRAWASNWIFGANGGKINFTNGGTLGAAQKLQQWAGSGTFTKGYQGIGYDPSWQAFGKGTGVFLISGSWLTADLKKALGSSVGFFLLPPAQGKPLASLGGEGLPWAISSKTKNADAAATYLNYITSPSSMQVVANNGNLTATKAKVKVPGGLDTEVYNAWTKANANDAIVPYLDWATPTMYDTVTAAIQELMGNKATPQQFLNKVNADYQKFHQGG
jgi:raffinose/stachyose/melibiose transport system substrate-binding protein